MTMPTLEGSSKPSMFLRVVRSIAYLLIAVAGFLLLLSPVFATGNDIISIVMTWFLLVGGAFSAIGSAAGRWAGEFTGLPLLCIAFAVFGLLTFREGYPQTPYIAWANLSLLVGLSLMFVARWRYVFSVFRVADRFSGEGNDDE